MTAEKRIGIGAMLFVLFGVCILITMLTGLGWIGISISGVLLLAAVIVIGNLRREQN